MNVHPDPDRGHHGAADEHRGRRVGLVLRARATFVIDRAVVAAIGVQAEPALGSCFSVMFVVSPRPAASARSAFNWMYDVHCEGTAASS